MQGLGARTRERNVEIAEMQGRISEVTHAYTPEQLRLGFNSRSFDPMFREVGEMALGDRAEYYAPHIAVWVGFEHCTASPYINSFFN